MTTRETILVALFELLQTMTGPKVLRNEVLPEKVPDGGLVILRDGDPGEPEVLLSPVTYYWQHRAEIEVVVMGPDAAARDASMDTLLAAISAALASNRTLDGKCDLVTALTPQPASIQIEGVPPFKGVTVQVELVYATADALG